MDVVAAGFTKGIVTGVVTPDSSLGVVAGFFSLGVVSRHLVVGLQSVIEEYYRYKLRKGLDLGLLDIMVVGDTFQACFFFHLLAVIYRFASPIGCYCLVRWGCY